MPKYKKGDLVRVASNDDGSYKQTHHYFNIGDVVVVTDPWSEDAIGCTNDKGFYQVLEESQILPVVTYKPKKHN